MTAIGAPQSLTRDELLAAVLRERYAEPANYRLAAVQRVGRLPADAVAVIEHRRATVGRNDAARAERAYRRAARLAAAVPTETPMPPAARLLAGVTRTPKEPR
jgi:hypothetical protein